MRSGISTEMEAALAKQGITTAWLARFDFAAETIGVWTGPFAIQPANTGDDLLNGVHFDPIANGVVVSFGDNSYSYSGSEPLDIVLGIPPSISTEISAADTLPAEWQARPATIWRAILIQPSDPLAEPVFQFRRIRTGAMDSVEWANDGSSITFKLTIESHASLISSASGMTYMNQKSLDANDTSQDYAVSIANGTGFQNNISSDAGAAGSKATIAASLIGV